MTPFVAEIRILPFNFPPKGWSWCDGNIISIAQNTALFSLLGTTYGGDGRVTFALPNLQGRAPMHPGQGQGLSLHDLGESGGSETVSLLESEIPSHSHGMMSANIPADQADPTGRAMARSVNAFAYVAGSPTPALVPMSDSTLAPTGGDAPHNNMQPYLTLYFCIALQGVFPPRT